MTANSAKDYGWSSAQGPQSCGYITPRIREILKKLQLRRVLDLGAGNGALCAQLASDGYEVAGVEYDRQGVDIAKKAYPEISFYL